MLLQAGDAVMVNLTEKAGLILEVFEAALFHCLSGMAG